MGNTIIIKHGENVPTPENLEQFELGIAQNSLYTKNGNNEIVKFNPDLPLSIDNGGTGAITVDQALINLDLENVVTYEDTQEATTITPIPVAAGGTGAITAQDARKNLGIPETVFMTQAEFNSLANKDSNTVYMIYE